MIERDRFVKACEKMGHAYFSVDKFIVIAMSWMATTVGDVHVEYHADCGWQVSTCFAGDDWGYDSWISDDDGSLAGALLLAVEATKVETV